MKTYIVVMVILAVIGLMMIALASSLKVGIGFGLLFLICPLMMLGMMFMMRDNHKH